MKKIDVLKRGIGVVVHEKGRPQVNVWAPTATEVELYLCKSGRYLALSKEEHGNWTLNGNLDTDEQYYFILDKKKKLPDPASLHQPEGVHGPSQITDLRFNWTDTAWKNMLLEKYVFYELHTGTFTKDGTFAAIAEKLDHLRDLGITAIEIMPVAQFPGERNWGYDGVFPFAVQNSYGGAAALQNLVNECHKKGIAVVLDVVYNHLGPEGNYLTEYGPYFYRQIPNTMGHGHEF